MMMDRLCLLVFFFKQKTAYEMRISDWSADVCSSDLGLHRVHLFHGARAAEDPDPISQAPDGPGHDAGRQLAPAAEDQHRRRHTADLRLLAAADAVDGGAILRPARCGRKRLGRQDRKSTRLNSSH